MNFKPGGERQIPYDLTYKWNLINKESSKQNTTRDMEIKNNLTVTRGERDNGGKKGKCHQGTCIKDTQPWLVWLSGLSASLQTKGHMDKVKGGRIKCIMWSEWGSGD